MKQTVLISFVLVCILCSCKEGTKEQTLYSEEFKWTITIPENYQTVSPEDWAKLQNQGAAAIEETYGQEIVDQTKTIFVFKNGEQNYLESNWQPFDTSVDGDYLKSCREVNQMLYHTFADQMPGIPMDTSTSVQTVSGLDFQSFHITMRYPNAVTIHFISYTRLFGTKEFSVNIIYAEEEQGKRMMDAWMASTFD